MSTEERIERFNEENAPFYLVDHGNEYSLCFLLGGTPTAAAEYGQYAFDHYAETVGKPVEENGWLTYGDGYDWECVFKEAFMISGISGKKTSSAHTKRAFLIEWHCVTIPSSSQ